MEMTLRKEKDILIVTLCGEIDHHEASAIRTEIDNLIFDERPSEVIFDFSNVRFMDSSGIGLVLGRHRIIKELGGKASVCGTPGHILKIFKMSGVDKIIEIK